MTTHGDRWADSRREPTCEQYTCVAPVEETAHALSNGALVVYNPDEARRNDEWLESSTHTELPNP